VKLDAHDKWLIRHFFPAGICLAFAVSRAFARDAASNKQMPAYQVCVRDTEDIRATMKNGSSDREHFMKAPGNCNRERFA
jgi:hypothetical protein